MKRVNEEFESFIEAQLRALRAQIEKIKGYLDEYEEKNRKLKKIMSEELIEALILRFEKNEDRIRGIDEKLDYMHTTLHEKISHEIRNLKNEISEAQLSKAISRLLEEKEIKVDSKPLNEFKKEEYEI